jgi:hypothetical protein
MRRFGWWALFGLLVIVIAFDALVFITGIVDTAKGNQSGGTGSAIVVIVVFLAVGVGLCLAARAVEHHVRLNHHPVGTRWGVPVRTEWSPQRASGGFPIAPSPRQASTTSPSATTATTQDIGGAVVPDWSPIPSGGIARAGRSRRRRHSPVSTAFGYVVLAAVAIGLPIAAVASFSEWRTSVYIQNHGTPSTLTVTQVVRVDHSTRSGNYVTINLDGILSPPVKNRSQTTVDTPHDDLFFAGETLSVLVDPHDPSKAELPGQADHSVSSFVVLLVFTVLVYGFGGSVLSTVIRNRRRLRTRSV